jgi:hypothetical protein
MLRENPMVSVLAQYYDARQDRRDALADSAYTTLRDELIYALIQDPAKVVQTPGFKSSQATAADVINDRFAGQTGEQALQELLRIVGLCAQGKADHEVHLRASAWIAARAAEHAAFHQGDLVAELEGDDE